MSKGLASEQNAVYLAF